MRSISLYVEVCFRIVCWAKHLRQMWMFCSRISKSFLFPQFLQVMVLFVEGPFSMVIYFWAIFRYSLMTSFLAALDLAGFPINEIFSG